MLDALADQLNVELTWAEGHQDVEGNLQADTLAKKGIATERFVWQDIALNLYENMNAGNASFRLDENSAEGFQTEIIPENPSFTCKKCQMDCVEGENCIQCQDCKTWIHYNCSMLPPYQFFLYKSTQRRFTCEFFTDMDEEYEYEL